MNSFFDKTYKKSELQFALIWIVIYCVVNSIANEISNFIGIDSIANMVVNIVLTVIMFSWLNRNGLMEKYGLCNTDIPASKFLWYIPLILFVSHNLWFGFAINASAVEIGLHMGTMLCVGILEEVIFRGFLFKAMAKDNVKNAIIVSSITFALGHTMNLINGSGMTLVNNIFQVTMAVAVGFLFVIMFYRGKTLWPCIIAHSLNNMVSIFADEAGVTMQSRLLFSGLNIAILVGYTLILLKTLPKGEEV